MQIEARYQQQMDHGKVRCLLCPHNCLLKDGEEGICHVRVNHNGRLISHNYGSISAMSVDPVEKKPLYHFLPGTGILSIGSVGCNMSCLYCQNEHISQCGYAIADALETYQPGQVVQRVSDTKVPSLAYTYNEPSVFYEFMVDTAIEARKKDVYNAVVSNGYLQKAPLLELSKLTDAWNVDLKAFNDGFYRDICGTRLSHVLKTLEILKASGNHVEITFLAVEGLNDDLGDFTRMVHYLSGNFGRSQVLHISRYFPRYRMKNRATRLETIERMVELAGAELDFVYAGNTGTAMASDTICPGCGKLLINRNHYVARIEGLSGNRCSGCNMEIPGIFN